MRRFAAIIVLLSCGMSLLSCSERQYCQGLISRAREAPVQAAMRRWAQNFKAEEVSRDDVRSDDGVGPGLRWLGHDIDGELLGFDADGHVRLVGPSAIDEMNDTVGQSVSSLMFTDRSRAGVLVRLPTKLDFGYPPDGLTKIEDDIAVLCDR